MLKGVLSSSDIKRIAVGKERISSQLLYDVGNYLGVVRSQKREVSGFSEMHFDGHELIFKIDLFYSRLSYKPV